MIFLIGLTAVYIYLALFYAAPGLDKKFAAAPAPAGKSRVFRNLTIALVGLVLVDGALFHSGLYTMILKPKSHAGALASHLRAEKHRPRAAGKEVLVIGDSRVEQGFDSAIANELARGKDAAFIERAVPASGPRMWNYFLREVDPRHDRYQLIVVPLVADEMQSSAQGNDRVLDMVRMAPLLRYSDALSFASSFSEWRNRARAFTACILRGTAYHDDLSDLLEHPRARISELQHPAELQEFGHAENRERTLAGLVIDPTSGRILQFPEEMDERQRNRLEQEFRWLRRRARFAGQKFAWSKQIVQSYAASRTKIVFVRLPRGPFVASGRRQPPPSPDEAWLHAHAVVLDHRPFEFLETPEYFVDTKHLNRTGQELFTKQLTLEILARLEIRTAQGEPVSSTQMAPEY